MHSTLYTFFLGEDLSAEVYKIQCQYSHNNYAIAVCHDSTQTWTWVGVDLDLNVPPSGPAALVIQPNSHLPKHNEAGSGMIRI